MSQVVVDTKILDMMELGLLVDYLETTNFDDTVVNNGMSE